MKSNFYSFFRLTAFLLVLAAGPLRAELPPAAQEALKKGIMAAKQQEWEIAIRNFQEVRQTAPDAPEAFYNLGLAESKLPGRELRAIAWFGAYLAAVPDAGNAAAVKDKITELQIKNEGNTSRLIKQVQDAVGHLSVYQKPNGLGDVAVLWVKVGDVTAALKAADLCEDGDDKSNCYRQVSDAQTKGGDIAGAQKTAELITDASQKCQAQMDIAETQMKTDDVVGAQKTLATALKNAERIQDGYGKCKWQSTIAIAQIEAGDMASALKAIASAQKSIELIPDEQGGGQIKAMARHELAKAQAKSGDITGAQKTTDLIPQSEATFKGSAQEAIAEAQIGAGDNEGAQKTLASALKSAELRADAFWISQAKNRIAGIQAKIGVANTPSSSRQRTSDIQPAIQPSNWLEKLDNSRDYNDCPLNTGPFLDLAGYLKSLPPSNTPQEVFYSLEKTAEKIITAQKVIAGMLKQQAAKP